MTDIYLGALSGTSMDAIDIAALDFTCEQPQVIAAMSYAVPVDYKESYLNCINNAGCDFLTLGQLNQYTGELFAKAVLQFIDRQSIDKSRIRAIGSHGQTLWHAPKADRPFTLQLGDPSTIAHLTGLTTVADFRMADIAAGGQGAPLAPAFHKAIFAHASEPRCVVNIGGFSNISVLNTDSWLGFDTGPGNCLLDYWAKTHFNQDYDAGGNIAMSGQVQTELLQILMQDPYLQLTAPKSTGREYFNAAWLEGMLKQYNNLNAQDVMATLLQFTCNSISNAIKNYAPHQANVFICGGGVKNTALMQQLSVNLEKEVYSTARLGIDPQWVEAALFAWLAKQRMTGQAIDLVNITGSKKPIMLGGIYKV